MHFKLLLLSDAILMQLVVFSWNYERKFMLRPFGVIVPLSADM